MTQPDREIVDGVDLTPGAHQDERGVDLTLIRYCLSLTPAQRLAENEGIIDLLARAEPSRDGTR